MKLYTKEQVIEMIYDVHNGVVGYDDIFKKQTPIELPSDEEIKSYSDRYSTMYEDVSDKLGEYLVSAIHIDGAKWMKEQILNQNK